ncbi:hypothetical protein JCM17844_06770 [Iodidimonas gelatinilytica]|uniref:Uncharacterized protein n=2 Tax=Iodidimonas gelatinilytica TaxID=1236966 RepID=A0A5A7MM50_9PROT|nr:hypothetical protein JCM17844_06770 [Iodidimonas gelatinilytica]
MRQIFSRFSAAFWAFLLGALFYLVGMGTPLISAMLNRLGADQGRLSIEECRLITGPNGGLLAMLKGDGAAIKLEADPYYFPKGEPRPQAERLVAFGFSKNSSLLETAYPVKATVVLESDGPAVAAHSGDDAAIHPSLVVRDADREKARLNSVYGGQPNTALARGWVTAKTVEETVVLTPNLMVSDLRLSQGQRRLLAGLDPQALDGDCRSRFLAEIVYGAKGDPIVVSVRPLDRTAISAD